jgi:hypothetical protein
VLDHIQPEAVLRLVVWIPDIPSLITQHHLHAQLMVEDVKNFYAHLIQIVVVGYVTVVHVLLLAHAKCNEP